MISVLHVNGKPEDIVSSPGEVYSDEAELSVSQANSSEEVYQNISNGNQFDYIVYHDEPENQDGLDLLRSLRKTGNTTPFIMVTDSEDPELARNALQLGAQEVISGEALSTDALRLRFEKNHRKEEERNPLSASDTSLAESLKKMSDRADILEKKEKEYDTLLKLMSRDFRDQINTISEFTRILDEDFEELSAEEARQHLKLISKCSGRVKHALDALQDYQRAQLGRIQIRRVDLSVTIGSLLEDITSRHPGRMVRSCVASDLKVQGDEALLHLCMDHLLRIAWRSTLRKSYSEITVGCYDHGGKRVFFLSNNGEAITSINAEKLENPFNLVKLETFGQEEGKILNNDALNLAVVDRILKRHNAELWTETSESKSTTFLFCFN